ncbi:uncharacterized protein HD556DRAFT_330228 [Suillus plorans]|uniref:Uncharacterized protein n=1 Tax=Suillus plorans TaxID=116603 RepID=A0A9P7J7L6_9AGAM|nr:uncharacterized protein HD556DRAFT_330228 [Suillus plorans]KAG1806661.1 hypothetical protein HD556DRAFT_330228 [Suillus plorans]
MNPAQNLIIIVYATTFQPGDVKFFIELGALDGGGDHPQAAGQTLSVLGPHQCENIRFEPNSGKLKGLGRRIALWCTLRFDDAGSFTRDRTIWWLQIWDWQYSTTSISVLSACLKIYSIDDMSQALQLPMRLLLHVPPMMKRRCRPNKQCGR